MTSAGAPGESVPAFRPNNRAGLTVNISINRGKSIVRCLCNEEVDEQSKFRFEPDDSEGRGVELDFFFELRMRRVIARQDIERAVGDSFEERVDIALRPQRRIHFEIRVEILNRLIGQGDVMRANFAADLHPARPRLAQEPHAPGRADVLAMNPMVAKFREQNVARDDRFLARRGPAGQTEQGAPVAFVHDAVADEIVVLAVIEHRQADHARVLDRATHQFVILHAVTVVGDRDHAGLGERTDRRQFFAGEILRNRAGRQNVNARHLRRPVLDPGDRARAVGDRRSVWHADDGRESARRRRARARLDRLLPTKTRFAEVDVDVDQAGTDDQTGRVDLVDC